MAKYYKTTKNQVSKNTTELYREYNIKRTKQNMIPIVIHRYMQTKLSLSYEIKRNNYEY